MDGGFHLKSAPKLSNQWGPPLSFPLVVLNAFGISENPEGLRTSRNDNERQERRPTNDRLSNWLIWMFCCEFGVLHLY